MRTRRTDAGLDRGVRDSVQEPELSRRPEVWGFNIARHIHRKLEEERWSGARSRRSSQVSEAGEITDLEGLTQGIGLDVRPFLAGRWLRIRRRGR